MGSRWNLTQQDSSWLLFVAGWLTITTLAALLSGWFRLMAAYPDQAVEPNLRLRWQSGKMGRWVYMRAILTLSICPSGLRVGVMRVFGPFCRDFFVPWKSITVVRTTSLFLPVVELQFGNPPVGTLTITPDVADRLARAAMGRWPEAGPFPAEARHYTIRRLLAHWVVATCFVALFFTVASRAMGPGARDVPIWLYVLFPAVFFGVASVVRYLAQRR